MRAAIGRNVVLPNPEAQGPERPNHIFEGCRRDLQLYLGVWLLRLADSRVAIPHVVLSSECGLLMVADMLDGTITTLSVDPEFAKFTSANTVVEYARQWKHDKDVYFLPANLGL